MRFNRRPVICTLPVNALYDVLNTTRSQQHLIIGIHFRFCDGRPVNQGSQRQRSVRPQPRRDVISYAEIVPMRVSGTCSAGRFHLCFGMPHIAIIHVSFFLPYRHRICRLSQYFHICPIQFHSDGRHPKQKRRRSAREKLQSHHIFLSFALRSVRRCNANTTKH